MERSNDTLYAIIAPHVTLSCWYRRTAPRNVVYSLSDPKTAYHWLVHVLNR